MAEWKPNWLTNRGKIAGVVFDVDEMTTFDTAEGIADRVCEAFGIDPSAPYIKPEAA